MDSLTHVIIGWFISRNPFFLLGCIISDLFYPLKKSRGIGVQADMAMHSLTFVVPMTGFAMIWGLTPLVMLGIGMMSHIFIDMFSHPFDYYFYPLKVDNPLYLPLFDHINLGYIVHKRFGW